MSLARQTWLPQAERLDPGRRMRVDHACGPGRTLLLSRDNNGYRAFCFRCGEGDSAKPPPESLAERAERQRRLLAGDALLHRGVASGTVQLPMPRVSAVSEWPDRAALWLYKAGLGAYEIAQLGAYYHPPSDRVVLPVLDGSGTPVFWQARAVDNRQPKYMAPSVDRSRVLPRWGQAPSPTLTEDILSAFKVGLVGEGWALMGTRVSAHVLALLLARGCSVNVWFDNDLPPKFPVNRGQIMASRVMKQLRAYGIPCRNIVSEKDPKLHTRAEIKEYLCALTAKADTT